MDGSRGLLALILWAVKNDLQFIERGKHIFGQAGFPVMMCRMESVRKYMYINIKESHFLLNISNSKSIKKKAL